MKVFNLFNLKYIGLFLLSTVLFSSCESEEGKELAGFLIGFIVFLTGTILTGIPAIILSALSINTKSTSVPILAIVLTVLYTFFFFAEVSIFADSPVGLDGSVILFPVITVAIIALSVVFIVMGFNKRKKGFTTNADEKTDVLDDIINSEDDQELL
jgi:hypothetical protein